MNQKLITTLSKYSTIVLVGGGTGGHIQPIVSLVSSFRKGAVEGNEAENFVSKKIPPSPLSQGGLKPGFLWIGGSESQEERVAKEENIRFISIPTLKLSTTRSFKILLYPFFLVLGFGKARKIIRAIKNGGKIMNSGGLGRETVGVGSIKENGGAEQASFSLPNSFGTFSTKSTEKSASEIENKKTCLFSKGGPGSVAIGIAAWSLGITLYIHESDTIPGRSNRILSKFATKIFLGFEGAMAYFNSSKCEIIGQILDPVFFIQPTNLPTYQPTITWKTTKPHILVICGSQGSQTIFESIISQFSNNSNYEWIIALGKLNANMQSKFSKIPDCQALEWISQSDIAHLIQDTNIAITRGSATTLAELTSFQNSQFTINNLQLIIIPLPYSAGNHQYYNALEYQKKGHTLLNQQDLNQLTEIITKNASRNR